MHLFEHFIHKEADDPHDGDEPNKFPSFGVVGWRKNHAIPALSPMQR